MGKTIWIINQYASTPDVGMGGRHYYFAKSLSKLGHRVSLVASSYGHKMRNPPDVKNKVTVRDAAGFEMVWLKLPRYKGSGSPIRVINWVRFAMDLMLLPNNLSSTPDVIYYSSPSLIGYLGAERLAKKFDAKLIFEVRDVWPLTLINVGGYSPWHPLLWFMSWVERRAYRNADVLLSNLQAADVHIADCGGDISKFHWFPSGILHSEVAEPEKLSADVAAAIPDNKFVVGYVGAVGKVNAIDCLLEAARILKESHPQIAFVLIGEGQLKKKLSEKADSEGLSNVRFLDPIGKPQVQSALARFDVCYLGWLDDDLYKFGIGANKIPEYLFSKKPVVHAYSGACDPIKKAGAGLTVPAGDSIKLSEAIVRLYGMSKRERCEMGLRGREYALNHYDFEVLAKKLSNVIFDQDI